MDLSIGRWALMSGYGGPITASEYNLILITKVTEKLVRGNRKPGSHLRQFPKEAVMATFASEPEAKPVIAKIASIRGERDRRVNAANDAARTALEKLLQEETSA